jgi:hypothetical protein
VAIGGLLVVVVRPPAHPTGLEAARGHRVFGGTGRAVREVTVLWDGKTLRARRHAGGWQVDGGAAAPESASALDDLVETLARLRALDVFRPHDAASYGLDRPRGTVALRRGARVRRLLVGDANAAGSAFYARRETDGRPDARVLQIGSGLASTIERVLYARDRQRPDSG